MSTPVKSAVISSGIHFSRLSTAFIRNIIFARLLSPDDFSIAMTFGVVLLLTEHITNIGHETLILRSDKGNAHGFQATLHSSLIIRGVILALGLILAAPFISAFFKLPPDLFNYGLLGIIPFIRGFTHLDYLRSQRTFDYIPAAKMNLAADISSVFIALICAYIIDSYWAFYVSFIFRHSFSTVISHIVSTRVYQLRFHSKYLRELISFSIPLLVVGVLRYMGLEADKAIIARYSGLEIFASYGLTYMLIGQAVSFISTACAKIFIRRNSSAKETHKKMLAFRTNGIITLYLVMPILLIMCLFAENLLALIFGVVYQPIELLVPVMCALMLIRILNQWQSHIVISSCNTSILIIGSFIRAIGLILALWVAIQNSDPKVFCAAFLVGEFIYFVFFSCYLNKHFDQFILLSLKMFSAALIGITLIFTLYGSLYNQVLTTKILYSSLALCIFILLPLKYSKTCKKVIAQLFMHIYDLLMQLKQTFKFN